MRLKIEINTKENHHCLELKEKSFALESDWYVGKTMIKTYHIDELTATKLRALFQRKKGRDLFDMARIIESQLINIDSMLQCFNYYLEQEGIQISRAEFERNLCLKKNLLAFRQDISPLLAANQPHDFDNDFSLVMDNIIIKLPGKTWKGLL